MVVSAHRLASEVGVRILQAGGNAVDAAVAGGYALAVVDPCCGNIGGGGFMTIHLADGRETFINFRETAPMAATPTMYLDAEGKPIEHLARLKIDGMRLDQYLAGVLGEVSRSTVQRVIEGGGVVVNGKTAKASYKVRHGDAIVITPPEGLLDL